MICTTFASPPCVLASVTSYCTQRDSRMSSSHRARTSYSLLLLCFVLLRAVIKKLLIHLHEQLQCIVDQPMDCPAKKSGKENKSWWYPPGPQPWVSPSSTDKSQQLQQLVVRYRNVTKDFHAVPALRVGKPSPQTQHLRPSHGERDGGERQKKTAGIALLWLRSSWVQK